MRPRRDAERLGTPLGRRSPRRHAGKVAKRGCAKCRYGWLAGGLAALSLSLPPQLSLSHALAFANQLTPRSSISSFHGGSSSLSQGTPAKNPVKKERQMVDANFPLDGEGRTFHLGSRKGEISNRILSVGDASRAQLLSQFLKPFPNGDPVFNILSGIR